MARKTIPDSAPLDVGLPAHLVDRANTLGITNTEIIRDSLAALASGEVELPPTGRRRISANIDPAEAEPAVAAIEAAGWKFAPAMEEALRHILLRTTKRAMK